MEENNNTTTAQTQTILVVGFGGWGKGKTIEEAWQKAKSEAWTLPKNKRPQLKHFDVWLYDCEPYQVTVYDGGLLCYAKAPAGTTRYHIQPAEDMTKKKEKK